MCPTPRFKVRSSVPSSTGTSMLTEGILRSPKGEGIFPFRLAWYAVMRWGDQRRKSGIPELGCNELPGWLEVTA